MVAHSPLTGELGSDLTEVCSVFKTFRKLRLLDLRGNMATSEYCSIINPTVTLCINQCHSVSVADNGLGVSAATHLDRVLPDNCRLRVIKCKQCSGAVLVCVLVCMMTP